MNEYDTLRDIISEYKDEIKKKNKTKQIKQKMILIK